MNESLLSTSSSNVININSNNKNFKTLDEIIDILVNEFLQKPLESDFLISLFYTTIFHRKSYILCNPFPTSFLTITEKNSTPQKNFDSLRTQFSQLPNVRQLSNKEILSKLSPQLIQALYFILKSSDGISVKFIDYKKFEKKHNFLKDSPDHLKTSHKPSLVFKINYNINSNNSDNNGKDSYYDKKYKKFKELQKEKGSMLGYHGSANENWFNIIKGRGFSHQFVSEECLFGKGFYFSSDSKVSTSFIKWGGGSGSTSKSSKEDSSSSSISWWPNSMWAKKKIGFLSACTLINSNETARGVEVFATNHECSPHVFTEKDRSLPPCYILADNPDDVRVKYMLLFSEDNNNNSKNIKKENINLKQAKNENVNNSNIDSNTINNSTFQTTNTKNGDGILVKLRPLFRFLMVVLVVFIAHFLFNSFKTSSKKSSISHKGVFY